MILSGKKLLNYLNRKTLKTMMEMYCDAKHAGIEKDHENLCGECSVTYLYALDKLKKCPYGDEKPNCTKCAIHCYSEDMRERIGVVMRYSGPRMALRHPVLSLYYLFNNFRKTADN